MRILFSLLFLPLTLLSIAQVVSTDPSEPMISQSVTITFNADQGNKGLAGYTDDVYAHIGVITDQSKDGTDWKYVKADWNQNIPECKMAKVSANKYKLGVGPNIQQYFGVPNNERILQIAMVFRNADGTKTGKDTGDKDIYVDIHDPNLGIYFTSPSNKHTVHPARQAFSFNIQATQGGLLKTFINGTNVYTSGGTQMTFNYTFQTPGEYTVVASVSAQGEMAYDTSYFTVSSAIVEKPIPQGTRVGVNYMNDSTVTLVLLAPEKKSVLYIGDQTNWQSNGNYQMNKDGNLWWITLEGLKPGEQYAYQYLIDGELQLADPYAELVLDPWNDKYIPASVFPNLKPYPASNADGIVSVFTAGKKPYDWEITNFSKPSSNDLVIYELHIRDWVATHDIKTVADSLAYLKNLGVNAIELMPINEFEGNSSWGYNPSFYFAPDKYYGTPEDYKMFVDLCHQHGMAVIVDMVLNHSFGQSPMVRMYWDKENNRPAENNPWYNVESPNTTYSWGYDFNHESEYTHYFVDRVVEHWLTEYNADGFRYDFTKGFTNTPGDGSRYDASRIKNLKRIYAQQQKIKPGSYMICEHFAPNNEEKELANAGMMIWGNMNYSYNEATMGYLPGSDLSGASYRNRGWSSPNLVTYAESHDEERLQYKNTAYGNSNGDYNIKDESTGLKRLELGNVFLLTIPGPKMIWQFQELGYDYSINHCPDGSMNEGCRTSEKPIRWDYIDDPNRRDVYNNIASLAHLKKTYPIFGTPNFTTQVNANKADKSINLKLGDERVFILGNFDVSPIAFTHNFDVTGWYYEFFSNDSIFVTAPGEQTFTFAPGEYRMYSTQKFKSGNWPLSTPKISEQENLAVFPNPSSDYLHVSIKSGVAVAHIYNQLGTMVKEIKISHTDTQINVSDLQNGVYFIRTIADSKVQTASFIKR